MEADRKVDIRKAGRHRGRVADIRADIQTNRQAGRKRGRQAGRLANGQGFCSFRKEGDRSVESKEGLWLT